MNEGFDQLSASASCGDVKCRPSAAVGGVDGCAFCEEIDDWYIEVGPGEYMQLRSPTDSGGSRADEPVDALAKAKTRGEVERIFIAVPPRVHIDSGFDEGLEYLGILPENRFVEQ